MPDPDIVCSFIPTSMFTYIRECKPYLPCVTNNLLIFIRLITDIEVQQRLEEYYKGSNILEWVIKGNH